MAESSTYQEIRNIAIIAHVDHGKTTLTDGLMRQTGMADDSFTMDTNDIERERGITIYSKNTSIFYKNTKINIVDTPGHADFGSEVERVLRSIDCVLLVVDAQEGPMPQTKFVLKKSLELGLKPIVVVNKIDKPAANVKRVDDEILELFMELGANDEQLDYTTLYAIGRDGIAKRHMEDDSQNLFPILDTILESVPPASTKESVDQPLRVQTFNLAYDNFMGRLALGRIYDGMIRLGNQVVVRNNDGKNQTGKITQLYSFQGLERKSINEAAAGDIIMVAGLPDIYIGDTICIDEDQEPLPSIKIDEPTISLNFLVNNSPFSGREGSLVTIRQIRERLERELEVNVGLKVDFTSADHFKVYGRGSLHAAVLIENMRREGYELQVSKPTVIIKEEKGYKMEPFEELTIDVPSEMTGSVIEKLAKRKGSLREMNPDQGMTRLLFEIPTRGFLGYRNEFVTDTHGEGILSSRVLGFRKHCGEISHGELGSMVSMVSGKALAFSLDNLQKRGTLYIGANVEVYTGMVIGNVSKGNDLEVNPIKGKQLTNMRAAGSDDSIRLIPPLAMTIELGLGLVREDEYLEVTPSSLRLRKQRLSKTDRVRDSRK